jgi:hypothetical protein
MIQSRDLFHLQTELIEMKVDMAVSRTIDRVVDQISALRSDMSSQIHELRHEMRDEFEGLRTRVNSVETKLGIVNESSKEVRSRWLDYGFKAGWVLLCLGASWLAVFLRAYV